MNFVLLTSRFALNFDLVRSISYNVEPPEVQLIWSNGEGQILTGAKAQAVIDHLLYGELLGEKTSAEAR